MAVVNSDSPAGPANNFWQPWLLSCSPDCAAAAVHMKAYTPSVKYGHILRMMVFLPVRAVLQLDPRVGMQTRQVTLLKIILY